MVLNCSESIQNSIIEIINQTFKDKKISPEEYYFKEGDFAEKLGVSRSTIREAIRSLETRGYVKRVHGKGVKAIDKSVEAVSNSINDLLMRSHFEYRDILQFRSILEVKGAGIAAIRRSNLNIENMKKYVKVMMNRDCTYKEYLDADFLFHEEVMKATQNKLLIAVFSAYSKVVRYVIEMSTDEDYRPEIDKHFHKNILEAISGGDSEKAEKCMMEHLIASMSNVDKLKKIKSINW